MGWDFTGIGSMDANDPGAVASATVSSGGIADWLTENIPQEFVSARAGLNDPFQPMGDAQTPWARPNQPLTDPLALSGPNVFSTMPERGNLAALQKEGVEGPGTIPGTYGLLSADPIDLLTMAGGGIAGAVKGAGVASSEALRNALRYRLGANPGAGFEEVARTLGRVAPAGMRPVTETAQGIADVVRSGTGMKTLGAAKEAVENAIAGELNQITAAKQVQAAQGLTGQYAARAAAGVRDLASEFKALTTELADATSAAYNRTAGKLRDTAGSLANLRSREQIYQDIQGLLSPDQWTRFLAKQTEYFEGSALERLFRSTKTGVRDVLGKQEFLQGRAQASQKWLDKIDPDLMKAIFRGGETLTPDKGVTLPFRLGRFKLGLPGTVMAGPISEGQALMTRLLGGVGSALAVPQIGEQLTMEPGADTSMATFLKHFNPFYDFSSGTSTVSNPLRR